jgi:hypothetical protein
MVILNLPKIENQYHFIKLLTQILSLCCFVFHGNKLALSIPMLCFFKGYISAESIPVLCLLWEQTSFISPNALFLLGLQYSRINPLCFVFYGNKQALLVPVLPFL